MNPYFLESTLAAELALRSAAEPKALGWSGPDPYELIKILSVEDCTYALILDAAPIEKTYEAVLSTQGTCPAPTEPVVQTITLPSRAA
jgi:hypothetical protein